MAPPPPPKGGTQRPEGQEKINIYARVNAAIWERFLAAMDDSTDLAHYQRPASQLVEWALRDYADKHFKRKGGGK